MEDLDQRGRLNLVKEAESREGGWKDERGEGQCRNAATQSQRDARHEKHSESGHVQRRHEAKLAGRH